METELKEGLAFAATFVVEAEMSAKSIGSGDLEVLATPALVAKLENTAMKAVASLLPPDSTTVGGYIEMSHLKPTPIGAEVMVEVRLEKVFGRKLHFSLSAREGDKLIGTGSHVRYVVDRHKFMEQVSSQI